MDDLVTWLRAQLDSDEAAAQFVLSLESDEFEYEYRWSRYSRHKTSRGSGTMSLAGAPTPRDVLAEVDAKRRILDRYEQLSEQARQPGGEVFGYHATGVLIAIRLQAEALADRPGYREEWRP